MRCVERSLWWRSRCRWYGGKVGKNEMKMMGWILDILWIKLKPQKTVFVRKCFLVILLFFGELL
jgi:predicted membrane metal-binding protein